MRSKVRSRKNPLHGTYVVTHARVNPVGDVDDLVLFATNDGDLYRQSAKPIIENLAKKMAKGAYDPTAALKAWGYFVENGARKYAWEVARKRKPGTMGWYQQGVDGNGLFPKSARDAAARDVAAHYAEELEDRAAELRAKVKAKKNPPSSGIIPMVAPSGGAAWVQRMPAANPRGARKKAKKNPSHPSRARSAEIAHALFGGPKRKVTKRFLKNESVGWNGFAVKVVKYGKDQTIIRGTGVSERAVPTSSIEDIPNWEWQNRWDKQWNGKKANPKKNPSAFHMLDREEAVRTCLDKQHKRASTIYGQGGRIHFSVGIGRHVPPSLQEKERSKMAAAFARCGLDGTFTVYESSGYNYVRGVV